MLSLQQVSLTPSPAAVTAAPSFSTSAPAALSTCTWPPVPRTAAATRHVTCTSSVTFAAACCRGATGVLGMLRGRPRPVFTSPDLYRQVPPPIHEPKQEKTRNNLPRCAHAARPCLKSPHHQTTPGHSLPGPMCLQPVQDRLCNVDCAVARSVSVSQSRSQGTASRL